MGNFLKVIMHELFHLAVFLYVDDAQLVDHEDLGGSGQKVFKQVLALLGWELDESKHQEMAVTDKVLGLAVAVSGDGTSWELQPEKVKAWVADIEEVFRSRQMSAQMAAKLAGRFNFGARQRR